MKQKLHSGLIFLSFLLFTTFGFSQSVFINEFHYDNDGGDTNEGIEIAGPEGTDLIGYTIALYNGNGGGSYGTISLEGIIPNKQGGYGMLAFSQSGIQNGPDALALVDPSGTVLQFISYEGVILATDGPANGMTSTDIMVQESGSTPVDFSLQLEGEGQDYTAFNWAAPATSTFGEINNNQDFGGVIVDPDPEPEPQPEPSNSIVFINEFHYDNTSGDTGEGIEIAGTAGTDLSAYSIVLYNGSDQEADDTINLSGILPDQQNGYGTLEFFISGIQNGAPDGFALIKGEEVIQFLSYEGSFTAVDGPAAGIASTDVGVEETSSTTVGYSIQLKGQGSFYEDFEWAEAASNTFGNVNNDQTFISPEPVVFVNELHYDNASGDTGEGIEIAGTTGTDLSAYSIVFYNGSDQEADDTFNLSGILPNQDNGYGTLEFFISGIQNGSPDGFALMKGEEVIQFLSYEGTFTAADGPAAGIVSTDIGVEETSSTDVGHSLQLTGEGKAYEDFVWSEPASNTFGSINTGQSFGGTVVEPEPEPEEEIISIAEAREKADGEIVTVTGIFTVVNEFGGPAYIQDKTGAIAIYDKEIYRNEFFTIGDSIKLTAAKTTYNSQIELIEATDIIDLGAAIEPIVPKEITLDQISQYPDQLVSISNVTFADDEVGKLIQGNSNFDIGDSSGAGVLRVDYGITDLLYGRIPEGCSSITGIAADVYFNIIPRNLQDFPCFEEYEIENVNNVSFDKTLDVVTWNLEFFGFYKNNSAPAPEEIQKEAVKSRIIKLDADLIAVEEVVNVELFAEMVSELDGYDFILSDAVSYPNSPSDDFGTQRVGFVYKTDVISVNNSKALLESIHPYYNGDDKTYIADADYPTGDATQFWASGRLPFLIETTVTLDGKSQEYDFVVIHAKSGSSAEDYQRREFDNAVLKDSLDTYYSSDNLMMLGDYNDDVDQTIAEGYAETSSYYEFINANDFRVVTSTLSEQGYNSTLHYSDIIDHIAVSNELFDNYLEGSANVRYDIYSADYGSTASDHFPVSARFIINDLEISSVETTGVLCAETATATATVIAKGGIAPYTYLWSDDQETQTATGLTAGDYSVQITDKLGNSVSSEINIESVTPVSITMMEDQNINTGYLQEAVTLEPLTITGGTGDYSYEWNTGETTRSIRVSPEETMVYSLTVSDANSCSATADVAVNVIDVSCGKKGDKVQICHNGNSICVSPNAVPAFLRKGAKLGSCDGNAEMLLEEIAAFPNPVKSETTIRVKGSRKGNAILSVYDMNGNVRMTHKISLNDGDSDHQLNISNFISGVYIVRITKGNMESQPLKIIKK